MSVLYIKNMVCDRCKAAVGNVLEELGLHAVRIELGEVTVDGDVTPEDRTNVGSRLADIGFELLDDKREQNIYLVKSALIKLVHYQDNRATQNISDYLSQTLHQDYSKLSKMFSEVEGKTIERYYIELRIERVKELIRYDELSLTQIAERLNYSSVGYLSSQFKSVTGMTPTEYKLSKANFRKSLDTL